MTVAKKGALAAVLALAFTVAAVLVVAVTGTLVRMAYSLLEAIFGGAPVGVLVAMAFTVFFALALGMVKDDGSGAF